MQGFAVDRGVFDPEAARGLQRYLAEARADIRAKEKFSGAAAAEEIGALYAAAAVELAQRGNCR